MLTAVLQRLDPGEHHLVCSLAQPGGDPPPTPGGGAGPLTAAVRAAFGPDGAVRLAESDALVVCTVLAAGLATGRSAGLVARSHPAGAPDGAQQVRGWSLDDGRLRPLTGAEVRAAYCTDPESGSLLPPEPGVAYRGAPPLPPPDCPRRAPGA